MTFPTKSLKHKNSDSPTPVDLQNALSMLPDDVLDSIRRAGIKIVLVNDNVAEYDPSLANDSPRGWPAGTSGSDLPGIFDADKNAIIIATNGLHGAGSVNFVLHEIGHAYDAANGNLSQSSYFMSAYNADRSSLVGYYAQPGLAGPEETFAESFALQYNTGAAHPSAYTALSHPNIDSYQRGLSALYH